jgi:hypothetical protein
MTEQAHLFHETFDEALTELVIALGSRKALACELWPTKAPTEAHNRLNACLNPEKPDKFTLGEIVALLQRGRAAHCHAAMRFLCAAAGYAEPVPVNAETEKERLQLELIKSVADLARITAALGIDHKLPTNLRRIK